MPSVSILAEPPVAVVDKVVDKKGTRAAAEAYLKFILQQGRPGDRGAELLSSARSRGRQEVREVFPKVSLFTVDEVFGGWRAAQKKHFDDKGIFDEIYTSEHRSRHCAGGASIR